MSDPQRQKRLLAVLLAILAVFVTYRASEWRGDAGSDAQRPGGATRAGAALAQVDVPHLNLGLLQREAATYKPGRDPFRFGAAPAPPAPPPKPVAAVKPPVERPAPKPRPVPPPQPAGPKPPKVEFTYLGSFGPSDRRIAVFVKDDEIYNALVGDILLESFIVDKIGFESADIKFVEFPDVPGTRLEAGG